MSTRSIVLGLVGIGIVVSACTIASPTHITVQPTKAEGSEKPTKDVDGTEPVEKAAGGDAVACNGNDFAQPDLSKLVVCGNGKGHCYAQAKTPTGDQLVACDKAGDVCVPDEILTASGGTLYGCSVAALGGADGACITASLYSTIIAQGGSALKQDVCDDGQLCVPCTDPTHGNAATPFCQPIGVHADACGGGAAPTVTTPPPAAAEYCCATDGVSNGICIDESAIPEAKRSKTLKDTCKTAKSKCVPRSLVEGNPVTCDSGVAGKGVCLDKCFNSWMSLAGTIGALSQESCGATEVCVPCVAAGKETPGCN